MDYLAHGLWSYIMFHWTKRPWIAVLVGLAPDTFSWGIYLFYRLFTGTLTLGAPVLSEIPYWVMLLYGLTHSIIVCGIVFALVGFMFRRIPVYMWAWPIVITMDMLTHSADFLPTPYMWPMLDMRFDGIRWSEPWFMAVNYLFIVVFLSFILVKKYVFKGKPVKEWVKKKIKKG